jgi:hypothetical protein
MEFLWLIQAELMFQLLEANVLRRATLAQDITDAQVIQCEEVGIPFISTRAYCAIATLSYYIVHTSAPLSELSVLLLLVVGVQTNRAVSVNTSTAQSRILIVILIERIQMAQPATKEATARPQNIHMIAGSYRRGLSASEMAEPKALVSRYMDCTKDFMLGGALV